MRRGRKRARRTALLAAMLPLVAATSGRLAAQSGLDALVPRATVSSVGVRTPIPVSLRLPAATVALSLGNVGIVSRDADVLFYNPGMLSQAGGVAASAQRFGSAATAGSFASIQTLGGYSIGLGARFVDWRSLDGQFNQAIARGSGIFSRPGVTRASSLALTGGVGRSLGPLRVGLAATFLRESFRFDRDDALLFDAGAVMAVGPGQLGLSVQGLGGTMQLPGSGRTRPWRTTLGYGTRAYPVSTYFDFAAVAQLSVDGNEQLSPAGGLELSYVPIEGLAFAARLGARRPRDAGESIVTTGIGVSLDRLSLDYALDPYRDGAAAHRLGIRIR